MRIVPVTCLAGRVVVEVTEAGDTALRVDVLRGGRGGLLRAGGASISPVGEFPSWPAESAGHHAALQRIASCIARDPTVLDVGSQPADVGPHLPGNARPAARARAALLSPVGVGIIAFLVAGGLTIVLSRRDAAQGTRADDRSRPAIPPRDPDPPRGHAVSRWELIAGAATMVAVVGLIDTAGIREPRLALALAPFACVIVAAFTEVTTRQIAAWLVAFGALAAIAGDARYIGLIYPVIAIGAVRFVHQLGQPR